MPVRFCAEPDKLDKNVLHRLHIRVNSKSHRILASFRFNDSILEEEPGTASTENKNPSADNALSKRVPVDDDRFLMPPPMLPLPRAKRSGPRSDTRISSPSNYVPTASGSAEMKFEARSEAPSPPPAESQLASSGLPLTAES